jgi:4-hydroxybenzoate polyprenyltransferase
MLTVMIFSIFRLASFFKPYFKVCRVKSWLTWIFSFTLGSFLFTLPPLNRVTTIFFAFTFATASIFILNQYFDRQADEKNSAKSDLPIASEQISPRRALIFSFLLIISCFILVFMADINLFPLFILYLGLWTAYSAPSTKLKNVPIVDFVTSGIGAGFLPFFMGLSVSNQPNISALFIILGAIPLMLFHSGGHVIQAIGDYKADREAGISTFVVRYGEKKGVIVAGLMFFLAFLTPLIYSFAGLLSTSHLFLLFVLLPFSIPTALRFLDLYRAPSTGKVISLQKTASEYGIIALLVIWTYILLMKTMIF